MIENHQQELQKMKGERRRRRIRKLMHKLTGKPIICTSDCGILPDNDKVFLSEPISVTDGTKSSNIAYTNMMEDTGYV